MAKTDLLKRSIEIGSSLVDVTRERAEALVKDLTEAGVLRKGQAEKTIDLLVERGRKRTEWLADLVRREVSTQLSTFGVATKADLARIEAKLDGLASKSPGPTPTPVTRAPANPKRAKAAPINKAASAKKSKKASAANAPLDTPPLPPEAR